MVPRIYVNGLAVRLLGESMPALEVLGAGGGDSRPPALLSFPDLGKSGNSRPGKDP